MRFHCHGRPVGRCRSRCSHIDRDGRSHDVAQSIASLGRLLDHAHDTDATRAVTQAVIRRLGVLTSGPGVAVPVVGTVGRVGESRKWDNLYLLTNAPLGLDDDVELRGGGLVISSPVMDPSRPVDAPGPRLRPNTPRSPSTPSAPEPLDLADPRRNRSPQRLLRALPPVTADRGRTETTC